MADKWDMVWLIERYQWTLLEDVIIRNPDYYGRQQIMQHALPACWVWLPRSPEFPVAMQSCGVRFLQVWKAISALLGYLFCLVTSTACLFQRLWPYGCLWPSANNRYKTVSAFLSNHWDTNWPITGGEGQFSEITGLDSGLYDIQSLPG